MNERVSHDGIITGINGDEVEVKILSKSACVSCNIKGACNMSEMKEKIINVPYPKNKDLSIGQNVNVSMGLGQANKAVIFAYVIPTIIIDGSSSGARSSVETYKKASDKTCQNQPLRPLVNL